MLYTVYAIYIQLILEVIIMEIILRSSSSVPIYEQIVLQIKEMIIKGELRPKDALPSMRKLAKDLHVSIITTQRAYDELSKDGFIEVIPAKGAFVALQNQEFIKEEYRRRIEQMLTDVCTLAKQSGIHEQEVIKMIQLLYKEM